MAAFICPKKEDCIQKRDIVFKLRDNINLISEEVPCNKSSPTKVPFPPAFLPKSHPCPMDIPDDDDFEAPCQNFKKRDIVNKISEEVPCSMAPRRRQIKNPCNHVCPEKTPAKNVSQEQKGSTPADALLCFKKSAKSTGGEAKAKKDDDAIPVKSSKSRELRAGILYVGCDCEKRNGLQDDCNRTGCHGSPECLTKPKPICGPSEFSNGKHLLKKGFKHKGGKMMSGEGEGDTFGDMQCFPAVVQKDCCEKCRSK